ncbi:hypothetical protein [Vibrio vulnificus]|uniref:hypothetical protein n=1 Tax=Vibrio vulnificus TaxID=672 RepID=UPI001EEC0786|nr:hypothetical protein [Vibrio vulnificus]MCG6295812.1 hypothetical protein [Vibrio vulnificus]
MTARYLPMFGSICRDTILPTSAIPNLYANPLPINGNEYVDGGVSASVPVHEPRRRNARSIVVIRTEPFSATAEYRAS